ncbi:MAG: hypothetical protein GXO80_00370 [Chlorobi bacterium]|nr:hypothetical protein [Chlorobiota bacterium]
MFAAVALIIWIYIVNRNKERMALIEKGADANLFKSKRNRLTDLKWGMLFVGVGIGILSGNILATNSNLKEPVSYFSMIFLFGGISLIIYYILAGNIKNKK